MALTEGVGKSYVSLIGNEERMVTSLGIYQMIISICTFFASLIAGILLNYFNVQTPFIFGSLMALISFFIYYFGGKDKNC